jgi:hypothetical protein
MKYEKNNTNSYQNKPEVRSGASEDYSSDMNIVDAIRIAEVLLNFLYILSLTNYKRLSFPKTKNTFNIYKLTLERK